MQGLHLQIVLITIFSCCIVAWCGVLVGAICNALWFYTGTWRDNRMIEKLNIYRSKYAV